MKIEVALVSALAVFALAHAEPPRPDLCAPNSPLGRSAGTFCENANALGEPVVLRSLPGQTTFRLTAIPSFKPAFIVRIVGSSAKGGTIAVRSWKNGPIAVHLKAKLTSDEFRQVERSVRDAQFQRLPVAADDALNPSHNKDQTVVCADGTGWVMEGITKRSYHVSYSECMPYERFDNLAFGIVTLARSKFPRTDLGTGR